MKQDLGKDLKTLDAEIGYEYTYVNRLRLPCSLPKTIRLLGTPQRCCNVSKVTGNFHCKQYLWEINFSFMHVHNIH